jgi:predicted component of type VI protein secretion system
MAGAARDPASDLIAAAGSSASWTLDALLSWLEERAGSAPGEGPPSKDSARLVGHLSLTFPRKEIMSLRGDARGWVQVETAVGSLYGTGSPLPTSVTEQLFADTEGAAHTRAFLDVLNHRLLSLGWLARRSRSRPHRLAPVLEALRPAESDVPAEILALRDRLPGLWHHRPAGATVLAQLLRHLWPGWGVTVEVGVPQAVRLDPADESRLGLQHHGLGQAMLGTRAWRADAAVRVRLRPSEEAPPGTADLVRALVGAWSPRPLDVDVEIHTTTDEVLRISANHPVSPLGGCRLTRRGDPT